MRILYINHYAGSERHGMEYRPYYLSREWVRSGHSVRVLAASFSHVRATQPTTNGTPIARRTTELIEGVEYTWFPTPAYRRNGFDRLRNIWAFLLQVWLHARMLVRDFHPEIVIASSTYPMDIWVARRIARMAHARLVFEVHDLWPLSPIELHGMSPRNPFALLCQAAETIAYRDADIVVSMLPKVAAHMAAHGLNLQKLHIIPNGVTPETGRAGDTMLEAELAQYLAAQRDAGRTIVGFAGSHGKPNALDVLLDAALRLRDELFAFVLVGDGLEKETLASRVLKDNLNNVMMFRPITKSKIPAFLSAIDIAYIGWQRIPLYRFGIAPNKLMDYMMAGCVVLHSVEAGNDPVAEAGCGLTVAPEDADAVVRGLRQLATLSPAERRAMGECGRQFVMRHHTYPMLAKRFLEAIPS